MTALPLLATGAAPSTILNGPDQRAAVIRSLARLYEIVPVSELDEKVLADSVLFVAQPRGLSGKELVAVDAWVRQGGRALIFTDPELIWPSELPLGDPRRPPPIGLLGPLLSHWGLQLRSRPIADDGPAQRLAIDRFSVAVAWAGEWQARAPNCTVSSSGLVAECTIGKGRALILADADMLDERLWQEMGGDNESAILSLVDRIARPDRH